jgi:hypothetical protein
MHVRRGLAVPAASACRTRGICGTDQKTPAPAVKRVGCGNARIADRGSCSAGLAAKRCLSGKAEFAGP